MVRRLEGTVALVTGATSGIGQQSSVTVAAASTSGSFTVNTSRVSSDRTVPSANRRPYGKLMGGVGEG